MKTLALTIVALMLMHAGRYVLMAGGAYLFFWRWRGNPLTARGRTQHRPFQREDLAREVRASFLTCVVFGVLFGVSLAGTQPRPLQHSGLSAVAEFVGWLAAVLVVHDTYFYWSHRLLHHPRVFAAVHHLHHRSHTPSPFSALAFHPVEAVLQGIWAVPLFLLPIPTVVWLAFAVAAIETALSRRGERDARAGCATRASPVTSRRGRRNWPSFHVAGRRGAPRARWRHALRAPARPRPSRQNATTPAARARSSRSPSRLLR